MTNMGRAPSSLEEELRCKIFRIARVIRVGFRIITLVRVFTVIRGIRGTRDTDITLTRNQIMVFITMKMILVISVMTLLRWWCPGHRLGFAVVVEVTP